MNQRAAAGEAAATPVHGAHAYDARVRQDQAESLLGTGIIASVFAFLVAAGMWAIFYYQLRQPGVLVWAALIHGVQAWRFAFHVRYRKTPPALRDPVSAAGRYSNALAVNGAVWGLAPWLFFPAGNLPLTTLMMMLLLGMVSGGMAALAPYRRALFSFTVPLLAGLAAAMLWRGDVLHLYLALCTLAYMYVSLKFGLQQNRLLTEALRARYEIEALSERLAQQVEIVERASAEKTRFFASASHDLRQPLHSLGLLLLR